MTQDDDMVINNDASMRLYAPRVAPNRTRHHHHHNNDDNNNQHNHHNHRLHNHHNHHYAENIATSAPATTSNMRGHTKLVLDANDATHLSSSANLLSPSSCFSSASLETASLSSSSLVAAAAAASASASTRAKRSSSGENKWRLIITIGLLLPTLAAIVGIVAWAISIEIGNSHQLDYQQLHQIQRNHHNQIHHKHMRKSASRGNQNNDSNSGNKLNTIQVPTSLRLQRTSPQQLQPPKQSHQTVTTTTITTTTTMATSTTTPAPAEVSASEAEPREPPAVSAAASDYHVNAVSSSSSSAHKQQQQHKRKDDVQTTLLGAKLISQDTDATATAIEPAATAATSITTNDNSSNNLAAASSLSVASASSRAARANNDLMQTMQSKHKQLDSSPDSELTSATDISAETQKNCTKNDENNNKQHQASSNGRAQRLTTVDEPLQHEQQPLRQMSQKPRAEHLSSSSSSSGTAFNAGVQVDSLPSPVYHRGDNESNNDDDDSITAHLAEAPTIASITSDDLQDSQLGSSSLSDTDSDTDSGFEAIASAISTTIGNAAAKTSTQPPATVSAPVDDDDDDASSSVSTGEQIAQIVEHIVDRRRQRQIAAINRSPGPKIVVVAPTIGDLRARSLTKVAAAERQPSAVTNKKTEQTAPSSAKKADLVAKKPIFAAKKASKIVAARLLGPQMQNNPPSTTVPSESTSTSSPTHLQKSMMTSYEQMATNSPIKRFSEPVEVIEDDDSSDLLAESYALAEAAAAGSSSLTAADDDDVKLQHRSGSFVARANLTAPEVIEPKAGIERRADKFAQPAEVIAQVNNMQQARQAIAVPVSVSVPGPAQPYQAAFFELVEPITRSDNHPQAQQREQKVQPKKQQQQQQASLQKQQKSLHRQQDSAHQQFVMTPLQNANVEQLKLAPQKQMQQVQQVTSQHQNQQQKHQKQQQAHLEYVTMPLQNLMPRQQQQQLQQPRQQSAFRQQTQQEMHLGTSVDTNRPEPLVPVQIEHQYFPQTLSPEQIDSLQQYASARLNGYAMPMPMQANTAANFSPQPTVRSDSPAARQAVYQNDASSEIDVAPYRPLAPLQAGASQHHQQVNDGEQQIVGAQSSDSPSYQLPNSGLLTAPSDQYPTQRQHYGPPPPPPMHYGGGGYAPNEHDKKSKGLMFHFGGGPIGGGSQLITSPMGIMRHLMLPLLPNPRVNLNGKIVFGVVLEKTSGFGDPPAKKKYWRFWGR